MKKTQTELARACGVSQPLVSKLSRGVFPNSLCRHLEIFRILEANGTGHRLHIMYPAEFDREGKAVARIEPEDGGPQVIPDGGGPHVIPGGGGFEMRPDGGGSQVSPDAAVRKYAEGR